MNTIRSIKYFLGLCVLSLSLGLCTASAAEELHEQAKKLVDSHAKAYQAGFSHGLKVGMKSTGFKRNLFQGHIQKPARRMGGQPPLNVKSTPY